MSDDEYTSDGVDSDSEVYFVITNPIFRHCKV